MTQAVKKQTKSEVDILRERVENLEAMIAHFASLAGNRNLSVTYGLKPWDPTPKDMNKYAK